MVIFDPVIILVHVLENAVAFVKRKAEREYINGVGVMIPVLHEQTAARRFKLREQFDHSPVLFVVADEHLEVAEINIKSVVLLA